MTEHSDKRKVVIAGGSGYLGSLLAFSFLEDGWKVVILSRSSKPSLISGIRSVRWTGSESGNWESELSDCNVLINLSGRSVDCRYGKKNRKDILNSRISSTQILSKALESLASPPKVWLNASSMALYGQRWGEEDAFVEDSPVSGNGFLEEVTQAWEDAFFEKTWPNVRQISLRISFVLGKKSGAFPLLAKFAKLGLGGAQGTGKQWMSWLHEDDFVSIVRFLIEQQDLSGPFNLASPQPILNEDFMKCLRTKLAPLGIGLPAPAIGVRLGCFVIGSAPELALQSRKVVSVRLKEAGYQFKYPLLDHAVDNLIT
jgi:uncharacterized protein (TIGR01777 family)